MTQSNVSPTDPSIECNADAARDHAAQTVKASGTSFASGMAILPRPKREAMHAIYAFCREVDDIADDEGLTTDQRLEGLTEWRAEIDRLYRGKPKSPTGQALVEPVRAFKLPEQEFLMMIEGMEMDAKGPIIAPSYETLLDYTRRVAGAVGLLSMPVFGAPKEKTSDDFALYLGDALQLTNILRDIGEDAAIGRLYLPVELLDKYDAPMSPDRIIGSTGLAGVAAEIAHLAEKRFAQAKLQLGVLNWRKVRPAMLMMGVYETYLKRLSHRGWSRIGEPLSLSKFDKFVVSARYAIAPPINKPRR